MFLPSVAERHRRAVLLTAGVGGLLLVALARVPVLESLGARVVAPLSATLTPLAGWVQAQVAPSAATEAGGHEAPGAAALLDAERRAGQPAAVPGVAWLEVPVGRVDHEAHRLLLAAGADFGLAPGMPVVFGEQWLGRIGATGPSTADVDLWTGAARRTPALIPGDRGLPLRAVIEGRGRGGRPLVRWLEAKGEPQAGVLASFRRGAEDPPNLSELAVQLGPVQRVGEAERGTAAWEVEAMLPPGAEGRVFVAAAAVSDSVVAEPPVVGAGARSVVRADGVFGTRLCLLAADSALEATVALSGSRVLGRVVARRGRLHWCSIRAPAAWRPREWVDLAALEPDADPAGPRFTRGGDGVPRGLFLGTREDPAPRPVPPLRLMGRVPLREPER